MNVVLASNWNGFSAVSVTDSFTLSQEIPFLSLMRYFIIPSPNDPKIVWPDDMKIVRHGIADAFPVLRQREREKSMDGLNEFHLGRIMLVVRHAAMHLSLYPFEGIQSGSMGWQEM